MAYLLPMLIFMLSYFALFFAVFEVQNRKINEDNPDVQAWIASYKKYCKKEFDIDKSLVKASFIGCGYIVFPIMAYIFQLYRNKIVEKIKNPALV